MYVKDMPSVASARMERDLDGGRERPRGKLELPLTGMADDRLAAAYAIVELGKGGPKSCEFPSTDGEDDLDADEVEQLVPRSPEYCRQDRNRHRCSHRSSADSSPARTPTNKPRFVHVQGAVMPSRTTGKGVARLQLKRKQLEDEEDVNGGIKAKLARMLFEKQCSRAEKSELGDGRDDADGNKDASLSYDEESHSDKCSGGRFVRTSMALVDSIPSHVQSPAGCSIADYLEQRQIKLEQSVSEEALNTVQGSFVQMDVNISGSQTSPEPYHQVRDEGHASEETDFRSSKTNKAFRPSYDLPSLACQDRQHLVDERSSAVSAFEHTFPHFTAEGRRNRVVINNEPVLSPLVGDATDKPVQSLKGSEKREFSSYGPGSAPFRIVNVLVPGVGLMPYVVFPSKTGRHPTEHPDLQMDGMAPPEEDAAGVALKKLEDFGRRAFGDLPPDSEAQHQQHLPLMRKYYPEFGSLNSITKYYAVESSSPFDGSRLQSSPTVVSKSWQDLTTIPSNVLKSVSFNSSRLQKSSSTSGRNVKPERPRSSENAERRFTVHESHRVHRNADKLRRKVDADVVEVIRAGEFGTLRSIRKYYDNMKSKEIKQDGGDRSSDGIHRTDGIPQKYEAVEVQDLPLDLSKCEKKLSQDWKCETDFHSRIPQPLVDFPGIEHQSVLSRTGHRSFENRTDSKEGLVEFQCSETLVFEKEKADSSEVSGTSDRNHTPQETPCNHHKEDLVDLKSEILANSRLPPKKRKLHLPLQIHDHRAESEMTHFVSSSAVSTANRCNLSNDELRPEIQKLTLNNAPQTPLNSSDLRGQEALTSNRRVVAEKRTVSVTKPETNPTSRPRLEETSPAVHNVAFRDEDGDLPLHIAVAKGLLAVVEKLLPLMLHLGVSVDSYNNNRQTALHLAVISNQPTIVEMLLRGSASPNLCDRKGNTAVHLAVKYKTLSCLEQLLTHSRIPVDLNAKNYEGLTALHLGVQLFQQDIVKALLANGANSNVTDGTNGRTPLYFAVENNDYVMASLLLHYGSNPCIASYSGCTPLQIATAKSFHEMTNFLERSSLRVTDAV